MDSATRQFMEEITAVFNRAVARAIEENKKAGISEEGLYGNGRSYKSLEDTLFLKHIYETIGHSLALIHARPQVALNQLGALMVEIKRELAKVGVQVGPVYSNGKEWDDHA